MSDVLPYQQAIDLQMPKGRCCSWARLKTVDWIQHLQWPAMVATLLSAWLVAEQSKTNRQWGFWIFLLSNVLWVAWGWKAHAYALIVLQFGLAALNIRGVAKNERA
jgi:hypothetical protein